MSARKGEFPCRYDMPRPWQGKQGGRCLRCDRPVDFIIETVTDDRFDLVETGPGSFARRTSELLTTFVCADHREEVLDDYVERYGQTCSIPATPVPWSYWLRSLWYRPKNWVRLRLPWLRRPVNS